MGYFLDQGRRSRLAGILQDIGQVALASIAVPFLLEGYQIVTGFFGIIIAIAFWYAALVLSKEKL